MRVGSFFYLLSINLKSVLHRKYYRVSVNRKSNKRKLNLVDSLEVI